ncbi:MAG TPA: thioredoxin family protein, partial [Chthoniobacterales bacterium]
MKTLLACSLLILATLPVFAGENAWFDNYDTALAQAKKENKPVLVDFTGSDWCPPCKMMDKEVFASTDFQTYAAKSLVLLRVDFPKLKPLSAELQKRN